MVRLFKKINILFKRFVKHPLTSEFPLYYWIRYYFVFHFLSLFKKYIVFKWIGNLKLEVKKGDAGLVGNFYYGLHEFEDSIFLLHYVNSSDVFLDVGANLGHYSLLLSGLKKCKSIAIEPIPNTFERLGKLVDLNKLNQFVEVLNVGVSDAKGELFFSTDKGTMNRIVNANYFEKIKVNVDTIDSFCSKEEITVLKIDVEGYEKFALNGAKEVLANKSLNVIIAELNNSGAKFGVEDVEVFDLIKNQGFTPCVYDYIKREIKPVLNFNTDSFNTLFIRDIDLAIKKVESSEQIKIRKYSF